jgi:ATP-dependent helicase HrpB
LPNENGERKIILSTPVAETSLTIEGVTTVIDSGLVKRVRYDAERGISRLETVAISIDSADQRAGRAGRLVAGDCYRLWTTGNHHQLNQERKSELLEADLSPFLLQLLQIGIENWEDLNWIDAPPDGHYLAAKKLLEKLELIENGKLSEIGKKCLRFGTHPRFAKMLCKAEELDEEFESTRYRNLAIDLIAILEEKDILPKEEGCDLSLRIEKLKESRKEEARKMVSFQLEKIENVCEHWRKLLRINLNEFENFENEIGLLLAFAFPDRIAKRSEVNSEIYKLENGITARMNSDD